MSDDIEVKVKSYARREGATTILRKMGVDPSQYNKFIKVKGGRHVVNIAAAHKSLSSYTREIAKAAVAKEEREQNKKPFQSFIEEQILKGLDNEQVFKEMEKYYGELGPKFKWYPAWNRARMRRMQKLGKETKVIRQTVHVIYE